MTLRLYGAINPKWFELQITGLGNSKYQNLIIDSKFTAIFLNWLILSIGRVASESVRAQPAMHTWFISAAPTIFNQPGVARAVLQTPLSLTIELIS